MERDGRADELQQHERRHRQPERVERVVGDGERRALVEGGGDLAEEPGEQPVDHERRCVGDEHAGLAQLLADRERGRERGVVGLLGTDDLQQRHQRDRVEEVEPDDPFGVREPRCHLGHGQRGRVGQQDALGADDGLDLGEHLLP